MSALRFDNLTNVRGLAAIVVMISHVVQIHFLRFIGLGTPLHRISSVASEYAVVVFFILSGFLIAHTLETNIERNGRLRLTVFVAARFARLYPPLLYAVAVSLAAFLCMDWFGLPGRNGPLHLPGDIYGARDIVSLRAGDIIGALTMRQGMLEINGPLWSLYIEAKLYACYACALALATGRRNPLLLLTFVVVTWSGLYYNPGFANYAAMWLTGCLAYHAWNHGERANWRGRSLLCGGMILAIVLAEWIRALMTTGGAWPTAATDVLISAAIGWVLFRLRIDVPMNKRLADCSYSLYATHFPVVLLAQSLLLSTGSRSVAAAVGVGVASFTMSMLVALVGGGIEARKPAVQAWLLTTASRARQALTWA